MIGLPFKIRPDAVGTREDVCNNTENMFNSPMMLLLGMTVSGGVGKNSFFSMLRDVYPYADACDRKQIEHLLCTGDNLMKACKQHSRTGYVSCHKLPLTRTERILGMMNVLKKYARKDTEDIFCMIERILRMNKMANGFSNDPMSLLMHMIPKGSFGDYNGILDMIGKFG